MNIKRTMGSFIQLCFLLIGLIIIVDTAAGFLGYMSTEKQCRYHLLDKTPQRGLRYKPWSTEELGKIKALCHHSGLERQAEIVKIPVNQALVSRWLVASLAKCATMQHVKVSWVGGCMTEQMTPPD